MERTLCQTVHVEVLLKDIRHKQNEEYLKQVALKCIHGVEKLQRLEFHFYHLEEERGEEEDLDEDGGSAAALHWLLPNREFHGLWDSLVFGSPVKEKLLSYMKSALMFADHGVDGHLINLNKVVLLHGPPGTGKTSLCKALAQKLTIRLSHRYKYGQLIEINSHSLFSRWYSESGKLVLKMFEKIKEMMDNPDAVVFILIDEVESLAAARAAAIAGSDPSDSLRVVNALLTQLDQIRRYPNILILSTSNLTGAIDVAFVDRADVKLYIGPPPKGVIEKTEGDLFPMVEPGATVMNTETEKLWEISRKSEGVSGRSVRKLPFLAHTLLDASSAVTLTEFLNALNSALEHMKISYLVTLSCAVKLDPVTVVEAKRAVDVTVR
ncbi:unnamed protein product [Darwinula stevensoni]|uniref:AAA+ ATPase domain-containing protein n=1 Tax=Darwinula stevensoni TaxID=69355 RepID=A0A7R9A1T4_9CRUS|nr:unnamed protein product [Darwinula stevensoni]CAG0887270.1 unnamed protein product [Darwinula stevensoni]